MENSIIKRRGLLQATAAFGASLAFWSATSRSKAADGPPQTPAPDEVTVKDIPPSASAKITVERNGEIVLIGINRTYIYNRLDPEAFVALSRAYYDYDHDPSLRAAVLFGHGENFSRGADVDAYKALVASGKPLIPDGKTIDPLGLGALKRKKPLVVVVHGDTWNAGHEIFLAADVRVAAADTRFGQDEASHGRYPGGGSTIRFVREAGWGNAMRYMLTGDHWNAQEAFRMGLVQEVAETPQAALEAGLRIARSIAACGPLGIKATLATAHLAVDDFDTETGPKLHAQYQALYKTEDFIEGRKAEAEGRPPIYKGR